MKVRLLTVGLRYEDDVVTARQRARHLAQLLAFDGQDQTRIATAVSEIARNAVSYGGGGRAEFSVDGASAPQLLVIEIVDGGPGIPNLDEVLGGRYRSATGMGLGIVGARRLMDGFDVQTQHGGTAVKLQKVFPRASRYWDQRELAGLASQLEAEIRRRPLSLLDELKQQNHELVDALNELERRQKELTRLNSELFDTNRGVLALYAELDEKADHLRRADELKTRFLSNMSHEFRTPLNSILALARLLTDHVDGPLTAGQEKQVAYIRKSATELLELVNDLLDLAKVEAGKITVRPVEFSIENLFSALRGMLRPLLVSTAVNLLFEDAARLPPVYGDEQKISQILRNFLSNALKFTESGEIRVSAFEHPEGIVLTVADTGIGIAPEDIERIFEEFSQVESPVQRRVLGTGLGLPLCRKLAAVLGGRVWVDSELGVGSRFHLLVPRVFEGVAEPAVEAPIIGSEPPTGLPVLLVEDRPEDRQIIESHLTGSPFFVVATDRLAPAYGLLAAADPVAVILDVLLQGEDTWRFLPEVKRAGVPLIIVSTIEEQRKGLALGAAAYGVKPVTREWLLDSLYRVILRPRLQRVLVADDDDGTREVFTRLLAPYAGEMLEARNGLEALNIARSLRPQLLVFDLVMPKMGGLEALAELRAAELEDGPPAILCTSKELGPDDYVACARLRANVLPKARLELQVLLATVLGTVVQTADERARGAAPARQAV
jgi:signal transduction histidine kinase/CheY-like chemotaxis protein